MKKVVVDIVCDKGHSWVKVVARNPKALDLNSQGGSQFGQKCITDQVRNSNNNELNKLRLSWAKLSNTVTELG